MAIWFHAASLVVLIVGQKAVSAEHGLFSNRRNAFLAFDDHDSFRDRLHAAVAGALGSDHDLTHGHLGAVRESLSVTWRSLAKNKHGGIDRRTLRYVVHRYLLKSRSVSVIGLEPLQHGHSSAEGSLLAVHASAYLQEILNESDAKKGFSIDDVVAMIAMLEELLMRAGHDRLEAMYAEKKWSKSGAQTLPVVQIALQTYLVRWIMGNDTESIRMLELNPDLLNDTFEDWGGMVDLVRGRILQFQRSRTLQSKRKAFGGTWHPFRPTFSFEDVQELTGDLALTFGSYWHAECERVKKTLLDMDFSSTGRVKLRDFHHAAAQGEWRFSESRKYLRQLGALDESSSIFGPRVIIPNYLQSASNCIVGDDHYRICCANDCESVMTEIEDAVRSPTALVGELLTAVDEMVENSEKGGKVSEVLRLQIGDIANMHNGNIPIHGRLFAQWLHYVFPRDCPFPHKAGAVASLTPHEFGKGFIVSFAELDQLTHSGHNMSAEDAEDAPWMTQWSEEEDLVSSSISLKAPWEKRFLRIWYSAGSAAAVFVLGGLALSLRGLALQPLQIRSGKITERCGSKEHYV